MHLRRLIGTLTATAALAAVAPPLAATADEAPLSIDRVGVFSEGGGYPSFSFGWDGLAVHVSDGTVTEGHTYTVSASTSDEFSESLSTTTLTDQHFWDGTAFAKVGDRSMPWPMTYEVKVTEHNADGEVVEESAPVAFALRQVGHPVTMKVKGVSKTKVRAGSVVKIKWGSGYEEGVNPTQIIGFSDKKTGFSKAKERDFIACDNSYCPDPEVGYATQNETSDVRLVKRFRVPKRYRGDTLFIHTHGSLWDPETYTAQTIPWGITFQYKVVKPKRNKKK